MASIPDITFKAVESPPPTVEVSDKEIVNELFWKLVDKENRTPTEEELYATVCRHLATSLKCVMTITFQPPNMGDCCSEEGAPRRPQFGKCSKCSQPLNFSARQIGSGMCHVCAHRIYAAQPTP